MVKGIEQHTNFIGEKEKSKVFVTEAEDMQESYRNRRNAGCGADNSTFGRVAIN